MAVALALLLGAEQVIVDAQVGDRPIVFRAPGFGQSPYARHWNDRPSIVSTPGLPMAL